MSNALVIAKLEGDAMRTCSYVVCWGIRKSVMMSNALRMEQRAVSFVDVVSLRALSLCHHLWPFW